VYPLISIRLKNGFYDSLVRLKYIDILTLSNENVTWYVIENPTLTGASWSSHATSTIVEVDTTATAITGGNMIFNGYATQKQTIQVLVDDIEFSLGRTHLASDIITFAVSPFANNVKVCGMLSWIEI
jgi:hypothetical protein